MRRDFPPITEADLQHVEERAASLPEPWPQEVKSLCNEIRALWADLEEVNQVAETESLDRQVHAFNASYWQEHCERLTARLMG